MDKNAGNIVVGVICLVLGFLAFGFYKSLKIQKNQFIIAIVGITLFLFIYVNWTKIKAWLNNRDVPLSAEELPVDEIIIALKTNAIEKWGCPGTITPAWGSMPKEVKVDGFQLTGNQRIATFRGKYRFLLEVAFTTGVFAGTVRTFDVPISRGLKKVFSGNFNVMDDNIRIYDPHHKKYPSELPSSKFAQRLASLSEVEGLSSSEAVNLAKAEGGVGVQSPVASRKKGSSRQQHQQGSTYNESYDALDVDGEI